MAMALSIFQEIAEKVGVSPRTVQRILNGELKDSRPTIIRRAERIRALAIEAGYRPNAAARAISTGHFGAFALLISTGYWSSNIPSYLLKGLLQGMREDDRHLTIAQLPDEELVKDGFVPRVLREWSADGLLVNYTSGMPPRMVELINRDSTPTVWINVRQELDCVHPDDAQAGELATQHLLELGHRHVVYLDLSYGSAQRAGLLHYSHEDRLAGYQTCMRRAGLTPRLFLPPVTEGLGAIELVRQLLEGPNPPQAIVGYGGELFAVERAARALGKELGRDLSYVEVAGQRDLGDGPTVVELNEIGVGVSAVRALRRRIEEGGAHLPAESVACELRRGYTSGPPDVA